MGESAGESCPSLYIDDVVDVGTEDVVIEAGGESGIKFGSAGVEAGLYAM